MAFHFRSMDGANFNAVANAIIGGFDYVAGALIFSVGGSGAGAAYFAAVFDDLITEFSQYLNAIVDLPLVFYPAATGAGC